MQNKIVFTTIFFASLLLFNSIVLADIVVKPAKLGIVRLTIQPLFPTISQGTFDVGNTYNFSLNVTLQPSQNISSIVTLSESSFTLQPNETRTVSYTIKPTQAGVYQGSVLSKFDAGRNSTSVAYQIDIIIAVRQSDSYILVLVAIAAVVVIVAVSLFVMKKSRKKVKK
jgi:hypothetical protein